ncbi:hypothetical protein IEU_00073 [Bacillus mycoides]|uniref:Uncharacterized protein n=1 Tax=Bacillus mycoides TaxID=1405 RepID=A0AAP8H0H4_BACMY|nr:hypothetical protein BG05_338 [Bacillus mycoides]EJQ58874.1 hypothetical protein IEY_05256 [Bacillus mycoides]EJQ69459.1 hypothetical protein IEW_00073 [Bacillus mycoides]EJV73591.1 hypothetical protein IEU_00073 [Bacillus mycoides]PJN58371.1 hypothetical protein BAWEI_51440 [Bacillus mycoides]
MSDRILFFDDTVLIIENEWAFIGTRKELLG